MWVVCVCGLCVGFGGGGRLEACSGGFNVMMAMQVGQLMRLTYCVIVCAYYICIMQLYIQDVHICAYST